MKLLSSSLFLLPQPLPAVPPTRSLRPMCKAHAQRTARQRPMRKLRHCSIAGISPCKPGTRTRWSPTTRSSPSSCPRFQTSRVSHQRKKRITSSPFWKAAPRARLTCEPLSLGATPRWMRVFIHSRLPRAGQGSADATPTPIAGLVRRGSSQATIPQSCLRSRSAGAVSRCGPKPLTAGQS